MATQQDFEAALRDSYHLQTMAGLMQGRGIDVVVSHGETDHGIPFVALLAQGWTCPLIEQIARRIEAAVETDRAALRRAAEEN